MNANPLKARYKNRKRLGRKGWKILGDRDTSMVRKKAFLGRKRFSLDFLGKEGIIHKARIKESNFNLFILVAALPTLGPSIVGYS